MNCQFFGDLLFIFDDVCVTKICRIILCSILIYFDFFLFVEFIGYMNNANVEKYVVNVQIINRSSDIAFLKLNPRYQCWDLMEAF